LALTLYPSRDRLYLSGFSAGLAALEGYNISYAFHRDRKAARRKIFYSIIRLTINTLCFVMDEGASDSKELVIKNFSLISQLGGLFVGLAYGDLYGRIGEPVEQAAA